MTSKEAINDIKKRINNPPYLDATEIERDLECIEKDLNGLEISNFDADKELKNYTQWNAEDIIYQTPKMLEFIIDYLQEFRTTLKEYNIQPRQFREACFLYKQFNDGKYSVDKVEKSFKMLEIIKHKKVNIWQFILCIKDRKEQHQKNPKIDEFNFYDYSLNGEFFKPFISREALTEEEFELLKEWLDDDK